MIYRELAEASSTAPHEGAMTDTPRQRLLTTAAGASEDRRATAIRILLALAEVDLTISGASLILPDGSVTYLDAAQMRRGGAA
jgi:hypothetical protein